MKFKEDLLTSKMAPIEVEPPTDCVELEHPAAPPSILGRREASIQ
jgi:hypothetical protein